MSGRVLLILFLAGLAQAAWQHARLPATVAAHFDATGAPDGWMSRDAHTALHLGLLVFVTALLEGIARLNARLPDEFVNIPSRDYWLAPERRAATHAWLAAMIRWCGCAVLAFLLGLFHQVYRANTGDPAVLAAVGLLGGGLLLVIVAVLTATLVRFHRRGQ